MPSNDSQWTKQLCSCFYILLQFLWTYYTSSNDDDNNNNASASYASTSNASASYASASNASASDTNTKSYRINPGTNNNCCTARKGL
jgi:hypothetical protein